MYYAVFDTYKLCIMLCLIHMNNPNATAIVSTISKVIFVNWYELWLHVSAKISRHRVNARNFLIFNLSAAYMRYVQNIWN
jgi:hypothetical protein